MNRFFPSRRQERRKKGISPEKHCRPKGHDDSKLDSSSFHTKDVTDTSVRDSEASIHEIPPVLSQKEKPVTRGVRTHLRRPDSGLSPPAVTHSPSQRRLSTGAEVSSSGHAPKPSAPPSSVPPPKPLEAASSSSASQQYHERARASSSAAGASQSYAQSHHDERQRTRQAAEQAKMSYYSRPTSNHRENSSFAQSSRWAAEERKLAYNNQGHSATTSHQHRPRPAPAPREREPSPVPPIMIEIFPGFSVPLRGSHETQMAVQRDFITPAMCFTCDEEMFCIQDAEYVLCPHCKAINPLTTTEADVRGGWSGGLGLGISLAALYSLQQEIVTRQS